jgi:hypothetical protein
MGYEVTVEGDIVPAGGGGDGDGSGDSDSGTNENIPYEVGIYYYHGDHLGSSNVISDKKGRSCEHIEYFPYGETWVDEKRNQTNLPYRFTGKELERDLTQLHESLKRGAYRGPVRCVADGQRSPMGAGGCWAFPRLETRLSRVQWLSSAHQALGALQTVLQKGRANRVPDVDISRFFDMIDHKEPMSMLSRRVADRSLPRLIGKWLAAGVVEENGRRIRDKKGTPQGGVTNQLVFMVTLKPCKSFN